MGGQGLGGIRGGNEDYRTKCCSENSMRTLSASNFQNRILQQNTNLESQAGETIESSLY